MTEAAVLLDPVFYGIASLPNVDLISFARYVVNAWSHRPKKTRNLLRGDLDQPVPISLP
jgi:hypothetical protein